MTTAKISPDPASGTAHPFRGVLLFVAALFFFACMDATTKYLATLYNVPLVMAVRYVVNSLLMVAIFAPNQGRRMLATQRTGLVLLRAGCLVAASLFFGIALRHVPLAEATAIIFLAPLLVMLLAGWVLQERVGALGWAAAAAGFLGVLLIVRPGGDLDPIGVGCALVAAAVIAAYQLLSRVLAGSEETVALMFWATLAGSVFFGASLPWSWTGAAPTWEQGLLFVSLGVTGGLGHFLFTAAYRHTPASLLAPVNYLQLLWAGLLGWAVFAHVPDALTIGGMSIVAASGILSALKSRRRT